MVGCGVLLVLLRPALRGAWRAVAWGVAAVTVIGVGFARIALGVHWVSDVVAGWLLGLAVLATTAAAFRIGSPERDLTRAADTECAR
ncbi:hypothetical protein DIZ27_38395 [Streptomyces sp. NWU339]|uniref:phosphatase PAP2 family protein n=1 Tax=Streptomyces sp. NWU339 TaxID=2185284 RepID=UPI000D681A8D|nr:phosphatase PAP2 family protein [Streptomyces sp. NWU339]PWI05559.1 hypothetical protein DIZ27_38395 [Streptomyces sp. NWU339]